MKKNCRTEVTRALLGCFLDFRLGDPGLFRVQFYSDLPPNDAVRSRKKKKKG